MPAAAPTAAPAAAKSKRADSIKGESAEASRGEAFTGPGREILLLQSTLGNRGVGRLLQDVSRGAFSNGTATGNEASGNNHPLPDRGQPLDFSTRQFMESRFGRDFGSVRVHTDSDAAESAQQIQSRAFTIGQRITFAPGQYQPRTATGRRLLAHELTHVVQQFGARTDAPPRIESPQAGTEREAQAIAERVAAGGRSGPIQSTGTAVIQRAPEGASESGGPDLTQILLNAAGGEGLFEAAGKGFGEEIRKQLVDEKKAEAASARLTELKSPANAAKLFGGYVVGVVAGVISPLTGLFDLAVLGEHLNNLLNQFTANVLKGGTQLVDEARELGRSLVGFGKKAIEKIKNLSYSDVKEMLLEFPDIAREKARGVGQDAAKSLIESIESDFKDTPTESWRDILMKRQEGESYSEPLGLVNSMVERSKSKVFHVGWPKVGYDLGSKVGMLFINLLLFALSDGIGNLIVNIGSALGKITPVLARAAEAVKAIGSAIAAVEHGIGILMKGVLKPLEPLLKELEPLLIRLRSFLRRLLGLAEDEAGALTGSAAKGLTGGSAGPESQPPISTGSTEKVVIPPPKNTGDPLPHDVKPPADSTPRLRNVATNGKRVGSPRGQLRLAARDGETLPTPKHTPPVEIHSALPQEHVGENALQATGTDNPAAHSNKSAGTQGTGRQPSTMASADPGGKGSTPGQPRNTTSSGGTTRSTTPRTGGGQKPPHRSRFTSEEIHAERIEATEFKDPTRPAGGEIEEIPRQKTLVKTAHDAGVEGGTLQAGRDGIHVLDWDNPQAHIPDYGRGLDAVGRSPGNGRVVLEWKGESSQLASDQHSDEWVGRKIAELKHLNDPMADELLNAAKKGNLTGRVYRTRIGPGGVLRTELEGGVKQYNYKTVMKSYLRKLTLLRK